MIINGNAMHVPLADESVGNILTSPPYNVGLGYDGFDDNMTDDEFVEFNAAWLKEGYRVISDGGRLYAVISDKMLWWFRGIAEDAGWSYVMKLAWCKPNFVGQAGRITNDWNYMTEDILLFRKGKRTPMLNGYSTTHNWFVETTPQSNHKGGRIHPAQWPVSLCRRILSRTPGEPVLDIFCGSGSAMVAAKQLGIKYIGVDIVETVARRAKSRVDRAVHQPQIIEESAVTPMFAELSKDLA